MKGIQLTQEPRSIRELVDDLNAGRIAIPDMQRQPPPKRGRPKKNPSGVEPLDSGSLWKDHQRSALVDTLYRGLPLPPVYLWRTDEFADVSFLIDGQQRLRVLSELMSEQGDECWDVLFCPEIAGFAPRTSSKLGSLTPGLNDAVRAGLGNRTEEQLKKCKWRSVRESLRISREQGQSGFERAELAWAEKLAALPSTTLLTVTMNCDEETAVTVFTRLNSGGTKLTKDQVRDAMTSLENPKVLKLKRVLLKHLADGGFGQVTSEHVDQAYRAVLGDRKTKDAATTAMEEVQHGFETAVDLIKNRLMLGDMRIVKSGALLAPMAVALRKPTKARGGAVLASSVLRWLAWAALTERYSVHQNTNLMKDCAAAMIGPAEMLKELNVTRRTSKPQDFRGTRNSTKLLAVYVALSQRPEFRTSFIDGMKASSKDPFEIHHLFPKDRLKNTREWELRDTLANLAFLTKSENIDLNRQHPVKYLKTLNRKAIEAHGVNWESISVDETDFRVADFWEVRRKTLASAFNEFISE